MKKILIITSDNFPHCGGKSTHIQNIIKGMKKNNIECDVISRSDLSKIKINIYKFLLLPVRIISRKQYILYMKKIELRLFEKLFKKKIDISEYDVINAEDFISCVACGEKLRPANMILTMHTYFGLEYTLDNKYIQTNSKLYRELLDIDFNSIKYVKGIICVDNRIKEDVLRVLQEKKKDNIKVYCIKNFIDTDLYKPSIKNKNTKMFNIICVRRLVEKNGVIYAVKAMEKIKKDNIILNIVGDGPERLKIEEYINKHNLNNKVKMLGAIDNERILNIYMNIDLAIIPSITVNGLQEATSIAAIEAMALGIPTIASDIGGLKELIKNQENGILVQEKNDKEIVEGIMKLYEDNVLYNKISENARQSIVNNFSYIKATQKFLEIYKEIMEEKNEKNEKNF